MAFPRNQKLNLLRLTVLLIVALAGIKFIFRDSVTPDLHKHISKDNDFWGKAGEEKEEANPHNQALELSAVKIMGPKEDTKKQLSKDFSTTEMRLVHLDLKGAAPKVSYLEQVFPLLSKLGANGILVEYEDMFPFKGELETLKSSYAYSEDDIEKIQRLAALSKLEVVPLVQTFGHVEFILKHDKYRYLREVERFPNSLNPHLPDTLSLLKSILSQVMDKHRHSSWIHIGADEVFHLGEGMDSKNWISLNNGDVGKMYLNHIKEVVNFIVNQYKGLQVLMWDDMLRKISVGAIQESGIPKHASPVLWFYAPDFDTEQIGGRQSPPISRPLCPVLLMSFALSRLYDHYSVLCELLPVGIPSLAMCLQTLVNGGFSEATNKKILDVLGFQNIHLEKSTCEGNGAFPGSEIYRMVEQINGQLKESIAKVLEEESAIKGWFSPYHRKHQFGNPRNLENFGSKVLKVHEDWENFIQNFRSQLESIYFPDTVEEWMEENVNPYMDRLREFVRDYREIIRLNAKPKAL
ncbi:Hexosaminidase D [Chelonia mydas]|uniref:beta-N-acetylhexosaminidase n=1 Tax=Chelonia mydas TaxID=8469 RepID=M7BXZ1_CHEMY|nr:Hexosaminidase D [Chelonia mydas]